MKKLILIIILSFGFQLQAQLTNNESSNERAMDSADTIVEEQETALNEDDDPETGKTTQVGENVRETDVRNNSEAQEEWLDDTASPMNSMIGAGLTAMGAADIAAGSASTPPNVGLIMKGVAEIALGMLAFGQAGADSAAAAETGKTFDATNFDSPTGPDFTTSGTDSTGTTATGPDFKLNKSDLPNSVVEKLADSGITFGKDGTTLITPQGELPLNSNDHIGALKAAGVSDGAIAAAQRAAGDFAADKSKGLIADLKKGLGGGAGGPGSDLPFENYGGAGGAGQGGTGEYGDGSGGSSDYLASLRKKLNLSKGDKDRLIEGKSRKIGGSEMGVAYDDIFKMIHRRYQRKRKAKIFDERKLKGPTRSIAMDKASKFKVRGK